MGEHLFLNKIPATVSKVSAIRNARTNAAQTWSQHRFRRCQQLNELQVGQNELTCYFNPSLEAEACLRPNVSNFLISNTAMPPSETSVSMHCSRCAPTSACNQTNEYLRTLSSGSDVACKHCKERKIRCDRDKPKCSNCKRDSAECSYETPAKRVNHMKLLYVLAACSHPQQLTRSKT